MIPPYLGLCLMYNIGIMDESLMWDNRGADVSNVVTIYICADVCIYIYIYCVCVFVYACVYTCIHTLKSLLHINFDISRFNFLC